MFLFIGVFPREREIAAASFRCDHCHGNGNRRQILMANSYLGF